MSLVRELTTLFTEKMIKIESKKINKYYTLTLVFRCGFSVHCSESEESRAKVKFCVDKHGEDWSCEASGDVVGRSILLRLLEIYVYAQFVEVITLLAAMVRAIISPSVLASDFGQLTAECARMMKGGAEWLHMGIPSVPYSYPCL
jgi:hypothetical protein